MKPNDVLVDYYAQRAREYDRIYDRPERQEALVQIRGLVEAWLAHRTVLELACGTGYWTEVIAPGAARVVATDTNPAVLELARARTYPPDRVEIREADANVPEDITGSFDAAFAGFWLSHLRRAEVGGFLDRVHARLPEGSWIVLLDNRFVEGSSTPISRTDDDGNTWQRRRLDTGDEFEIVKNFWREDELRAAAGVRASDLEHHDLRYYWALRYRLGA